METVLVVDDDRIVLDLICEIVNKSGFISIEAEDGFKAIEVFENNCIDAAILDLKMPSIDGIETMKKLRKIDYGLPVIIMTAYGDIPTAVEAMKYGAYDFVTKPPDFKRLIMLLKEAIRRRKSNSLKKELVKSREQYKTERSTPEKTEKREPGICNSLSEREYEVLYLTALGYSYTNIASKLSISPRTVQTYRENLLKKLGLTNKTDLIHYAIKKGIIP